LLKYASRSMANSPPAIGCGKSGLPTLSSAVRLALRRARHQQVPDHLHLTHPQGRRELVLVRQHRLASGSLASIT
jgi:hypothetical protein